MKGIDCEAYDRRWHHESNGHVVGQEQHCSSCARRPSWKAPSAPTESVLLVLSCTSILHESLVFKFQRAKQHEQRALSPDAMLAVKGFPWTNHTMDKMTIFPFCQHPSHTPAIASCTVHVQCLYFTPQTISTISSTTPSSVTNHSAAG